MDDWLLVVEKGEPISEAQLEVCKVIKPPLKGVVMCSPTGQEEEEGTKKLCDSVDRFPAFCSVTKKGCLYGYRDKESDFQELTISTPRESSTRQTQQPPPG
jgi:hypothetical protein